MDTEKKFKLEDILLKEKIVSQEQLARIFKIQSRLPEPKPIEDICVEMGLIWKNDLKELLKRYQGKMLLGELFVSIGLAAKQDIKKALEIQKKTKKRLGEILVEMGTVTEGGLTNTLSIQLDIPKIDPQINLIDKNLLKKINEKYLKKNLIIPAYKENNIIILIMEDPLDTDSIKYFSEIFSCKVQPAIAAKTDIKRALYELFDKLKAEANKNNKSIEKIEKSRELIIGDVKYPYGKDRIIDTVNYLISSAIMEGASDIHIEPQFNKLQVRFRIDGILHHKTDIPLSIAPPLASRIKVLCGLDIAEKRKHQDGRVGAVVLNNDVDVRISTYASIYGETIVIRLLQRHSNLMDINRLGFSPVTHEKYESSLNNPSGIMLVTGPTGSGKTTTLYASLSYLNDLRRKIITVEDPIEYTIPGVTQGSINRKIGMGYVEFLKSMMRQDPDVLMIGEIREKESAEMTIQAALTGHKVFSTFHTENTTGALLRLMDMGIETFLISSTVVSVLSQRLIRVVCKECKEKYTPNINMFRSFKSHGSIDLKKYTFFRGRGCSKCNNTGFKGRTGIYEFLVVNNAIRNAILARKTSPEIRQIAKEQTGLISIKEDGFYKAVKGITTIEEVLRVVFHGNENDKLTTRSPEEIIHLCEKKQKKIVNPIDPEVILSRSYKL